MWLDRIANAICKTKLNEALSEAHEVHEQVKQELKERDRLNQRLTVTIQRQRRELAQIFYEEMQRAEDMFRK